MKTIITILTAATISFAIAAPASAGRTVCNTYGSRTVCTYTPTCNYVATSSGWQQVCS